ncbi:pantetheine-phosphate adenylyltransferase [archaeon]|jgi:pantetheine-phosphate adenylyltransferase/dephospho-CoA kinase|nr:pantetheine-phosphate adenylyltransferase [archaeon]MBT3450576.1 pantetheine-phosphate adenylyltransferase [archaeon]MBT6868430.1 pantetheine-phosphate adenylyltransferase [archaeon]MBT7193529.1 pantetheine-phosphate adenylyltransferase [archaeon]MBT7381276.1 pantetheine-phosphate adenylyltransferase [archaeon]
MVKAIYAFSGDPITYGHMDIVERASKAFDEVIVGIGVNPKKNYMFTLAERTEMANKALGKYLNVTVDSFEGLLVSYAYEKKIGVIVKGVRGPTDVEYESLLHQIGETQKLGIDTHVLFARPHLTHVSSSNVKAIQSEHGLIHEFVPLDVKQRLEERISKQYVLGVTGEIGAGKSYVSKKLVELGTTKGIEVHNIELDHIGHQIITDLKEPRYITVREEIMQTFGPETRNSDGSINRKMLGELIFNNTDAREKLNKIMGKPLLVRYQKELYRKEGLILLNAALIAETGMSYLCNNNVALVNVSKDVQRERLEGRGHSPEQIERRIVCQHSYLQKRDCFVDAIKKDNHGQIFEFDNSNKGNDDEIDDMLENIISQFGMGT